MKKRIFSILALLLMAVSLTACGNDTTRISEGRIKEFMEIAENIKANPEYKLPEGFSFKNASETETGKIVIIAKGEKNKSNVQYATFDITKEEVQLEKMEERIKDTNYYIIVAFVLGIFIGILIMT